MPLPVIQKTPSFLNSPLKHMGRNTHGIILAIFGFFIFSCGDVIVKVISADYHLFQIVFWAQIPALITLLCLGFLNGNPDYIYRSDTWRLHLMRGIVLGSQVFFSFYAFSNISLAQAYTFVFCAPLFASLISFFALKEDLSKFAILALLTGFTGVLIALRPGFQGLELGMISAIFAGFLFALGYVMGRRLQTHSTLTLGFYPGMCAFLMSGICVFFFDLRFLPNNLIDCGLICLLGLTSVAGILSLSKAYSLASVPAVSSFHYSQLLWGSLFGFFIFHEITDMFTYIGAIFIIVSGIVMIWQEALSSKT